MNTAATSKEEVLRVSRELIQKQGWSAVSIRTLASACGVSVGTIYNYFDSKSELMSATVESVWCDIFHLPENDERFCDIISCILWVYQKMEEGAKRYPGFFSLHSVGFMDANKADAKKRMQETWQHILDGFCAVLSQDENIRADAFDRDFTPQKFSKMLFSFILSASIQKDYDPSTLLVMVRRTLYTADMPLCKTKQNFTEEEI